MKITRYYAWFPNRDLLVGPFFRRARAEEAAAGHTSDPLLSRLIWQGGGSVLTRAQAKRRPPRPSLDLNAYARAHVTSAGAHALLDEIERGNMRQPRPRHPY